MKFRLLAGTALAAVLPPAAGQAQDVIGLAQIVISANLDETEARRTGSSVTVVTEEELAATGEMRVIDFLSRLPGVSVRPTGPIGTRSGIAIRGASQNYVSVIVDGIDVTDPSSTQVAFDFGSLTTADIGRIEVLRGSQSALYGSGAIGGVITITTKRATEDGTFQQAAIEAGSYATVRAAYNFQTKSGPTDLSFSISHVQTDGFSAADENDGNTEADGYRADRISVTANHQLDSGVVLSFAAFAEDGEGEYDEDFPLGDGTPDEVASFRSVGLRGAVEFETGAITNTLAATLYRIDREYETGTIFGFSTYGYTGTRTGLSYQGRLALGEASRLTFGADWNRERYQQSGDFGSADYATRIGGVFAEIGWAPDARTDITATVRHDDHSRFGGFTTGRLSVAFRPSDDWTLRAVAATGYRAPSNYELFGDFVGNPDLQPETSRSAEIGAEYAGPGGLRVSGTLFWLEATDLIDYDFGTGTYVQVPGVSRRQGLELAAEAPVADGVRVNAAYTYTDSAVNAATSWGRVPRHAVALGVEAELAANLTGAFTVEHAADRATLPDYTVANATLTYDFGEGREAYFRIENLFDEQYQLVPGYGTSDRAFYAGLRVSF